MIKATSLSISFNTCHCKMALMQMFCLLPWMTDNRDRYDLFTSITFILLSFITTAYENYLITVKNSLSQFVTKCFSYFSVSTCLKQKIKFKLWFFDILLSKVRKLVYGKSYKISCSCKSLGQLWPKTYSQPRRMQKKNHQYYLLRIIC